MAKNRKMSQHALLKRKEYDRERKIFLMVGFLLLAVVVFGSKIWLDYQKHKISTIQYKYSSSDFVSTIGYQIQDDVYTMVEEDPQIILQNKLSNVDSLKISFKKPIESNMNIQVYYHEKGDVWSEENSVISNLASGIDEMELDIAEGKYEGIRIDLNGNFVLNDIYLYGHNKKKVPFRDILVVCILNVLLVAFWTISLKKQKRFIRIIVKSADSIVRSYESVNSKIFDLGEKYSFRLEKIFIVLGLVLGLTYSFLIPPGQVPDEQKHAEYMSTNLGYGEKMHAEIREYLESIEFYNMTWDSNVKQNKDRIWKNMGTKFSSEARRFTKLPSISSVRYFPANIGYAISVSLNLPIYFCLQIAEFFSVIFYAICGYYTLKRIPILKGALFTVMIVPMTLQQSASISYDVIILSGSFYLFSYLLCCMMEKEKIGWKEVFVIMLWGGLLSSIKPPYVFLLVLFFAINKDKIQLPVIKIGNIYAYVYMYRYLVGIAMLLAICVYIPHSAYGNLIKAVILDFPHTIEVFLNTFSTLWDHYLISIVGKFGWLLYPMSNAFEIFTYILLALVAMGSVKYNNSTAFARILCGIGVIFGVLFIFLAMITWTFRYVTTDEIDSFKKFQEVYAQMDYILGVQGRYFIPFIPLLMYALHGIVNFSRKKHMLTIIITYAIWIVWPIVSIVHMFWE